MYSGMPAADIRPAFTETRDELASLGIEDPFFCDLLAARLVIERVGDTENLKWWDSYVLSETGRKQLAEVTPKTTVQARLDLAQKVGRKAESDALPDDTISLYSFSPRIESRIAAAIEDLESDAETQFSALEELSVTTVAENWTDPLIDALDSTATSAETEFGMPEPSGALRIAEDGFTQDEVTESKWTLLATFLKGYGTVTESLRVPYYPLESDLQSTTA